MMVECLEESSTESPIPEPVCQKKVVLEESRCSSHMRLIWGFMHRHSSLVIVQQAGCNVEIKWSRTVSLDEQHDEKRIGNDFWGFFSLARNKTRIGDRKPTMWSYACPHKSQVTDTCRCFSVVWYPCTSICVRQNVLSNSNDACTP
jgi:hypothetical protein